MHVSKEVLIAVNCRRGFLPSTETFKNKPNHISFEYGNEHMKPSHSQKNFTETPMLKPNYIFSHCICMLTTDYKMKDLFRRP